MAVSKKQFEKLEMEVLMVATEVAKLIKQYNENMVVINAFMNEMMPKEKKESPIITL